MPQTGKIPVGVVGMGLMGTSIATCLLAHGHPVVGVEPQGLNAPRTRRRIRRFLRELQDEGMLPPHASRAGERLDVSSDFAALRGCELVFESIVESLEAKRAVLRAVERVVSRSTLIGSNTSALPITQLQHGARHPHRIMGVHWAEPAHLTRFLEVICGRRTKLSHAQRMCRISRLWKKQPTLIRKDIRGFIANRIMYAMLREAFHLVESKVATVADVDRSVRNDAGFWLTLAGPFRIMDLTGIPAFARVMKDLLPDLSRQQHVPALMRKVVKSGARGIANAKGFYSYTPAQARRWEARYRAFTADIRRLAAKYDVEDAHA